MRIRPILPLPASVCLSHVVIFSHDFSYFPLTISLVLSVSLVRSLALLQENNFDSGFLVLPDLVKRTFDLRTCPLQLSRYHYQATFLIGEFRSSIRRAV